MTQPPGNESSTVLANISSSNSTNSSAKDPNSDNLTTGSRHEGVTEGTSIESRSSAEHMEGKSAIDIDTNIPEGFFDDPIQDAKVRFDKFLKYICRVIRKSLKNLSKVLISQHYGFRLATSPT